ncbi:MAG: GAF domain-containing protein [Acidobacteriia bacterium]|nr:GAF domain-containing protein [Terriglobia bacterium]
MSLNRHILTLDQQFFQSVLSAAFTIQEHNDRRKLAGRPPVRQSLVRPEAHPKAKADRLCEHCGAPLPADGSPCASCGLEEFRPGEPTQPNWASTWLMNQEPGLWSQRSPQIREGPQTGVPPLDVEPKPLAQASSDSARPGSPASPVAEQAAKETIKQEETEAFRDRAPNPSALDRAEATSQRTTEGTEHLTPEDRAPEGAQLTVQPIQSSAGDAAGTGDRAVSNPRFNGVPAHFFLEIARQALQATHAAGAAIALQQQEDLTCRAATGDFASEIGKMISTRTGFTGVCVSSGTMQLCSNTALDPREDAGACRKIGVGAIILVPLVHQDRCLGLIAVFSRRPYAFGMRDLQALHDLAQKSAANLQLSAEPANANPTHESPASL